MASTILQDKWGYFWRADEAGFATSLSDDQGRLPVRALDEPVMLIDRGKPTGFGDVLATRVALHCVNKGLW